MIPKEAKPFLRAYYVLQILKEHDCEEVAIFIALDGTASLVMSHTEYGAHKTLAENLMKSNKWYVDAYGNFCISCPDGMKLDEEEEENEKETIHN